MDQFSQPVLSKKLLTIIANSTTSTNQIIFKRAIVSSDKYKLDDLSGFDDNSISTVKKASETVFSNVTIDGNGIQLTAIFSSNGNDSNYDINTILFTAEYGGQEFLAFSQIANYSLTVPAGSSKEVFNLTLKPKIVVDSTKTISTNVSPDAIATNEHVEQKTSELNSKISDIQNKQSDLLDELSEKISKSGNPQTIDTKLTFTEKINGVITGADALATPRNIGGVEFDGTSDITLPGVNAMGNQNTTGLANAVQSLEITNGTDLSTVKGYGGSAVYRIASGISLTSAPSDYSGKGAILKVTESGTTVYQELIDVVTDNGAWIRIISGSTVNDWQTKGGGGKWELVANGQYYNSISKYFTGIYNNKTDISSNDNKGRWYFVTSDGTAHLVPSAFDFTKYEYLIIFAGRGDVISSTIPGLPDFNTSDSTINKFFIPRIINLGGSIGTNWSTATYTLYPKTGIFIIRGVFRRHITRKTPVEADLYTKDYPFIPA